MTHPNPTSQPVGVSWKLTPSREKWAITWGIWWRMIVIGLGIYMVVLVGALLLLLIVALLGGFETS